MSKREGKIRCKGLPKKLRYFCQDETDVSHVHSIFIREQKTEPQQQQQQHQQQLRESNEKIELVRVFLLRLGENF
jgi:hypothetical protein